MPIEIRPGLTIADRWLEFRTSRSGGPGGQNVNKVETRVELRFDLDGCDQLRDYTKGRVRTLAGRRMTKDGVLQMICGRSRDQAKNREEVQDRLRSLLLDALRPPPKPRKKTKPSRSSQRKRVARKRSRGDLKKGRKKRFSED